MYAITTYTHKYVKVCMRKLYVRIHEYNILNVCMRVYIYVCMQLHEYVFMYECMYVYICMYVCIYVCMYVCMYVHM